MTLDLVKIDQDAGARGARTRLAISGGCRVAFEAGLALCVVLLLMAGAIVGPAAAQDSSSEDRDSGQTAEDFFFEDDDPSGELDEEAELEEAEAVDDIFQAPVLEEASDEHAGVEELIVTAAKRAQSVQDVPISVTAIGGKFLEETGSTNFADLQKFVPNLQILPVTDTRSTSIRIRGIGSVGTNAGIDPSVGVFIDGVYQGRAGMSVSDLLDIERIEVLRGPQGTLYGKNTAAGAINIITKNPTDEPTAFAETVVGNYNLLEFRGSMNGPLITDKVAARVAGYKVTRQGYDVNTFDDERVNDADKWGIRGKLRWMGSDNLDIILSGDYSVNESTCCVGGVTSYQGPPTLGVTFQDLAAETGTPLPDLDLYDREVGIDVQPINDVSVGGIALDANLELGVYDLRWLTSYRNYQSDSQFDGDFSIYDAVISLTEVDFNQVSSEILMVSPGGETVEWQAGTYFFYSNLQTDDALGYSQLVADISPILLGPALNLNLNQHRTFNWAAFGQATWNVDDEWSLTGGFRFDYEKKLREGSSFSTCLIPAPPVCGPPDERDEQRHVWNPQGTVIARYRPTDLVMIYASFANGFKSGGFNQVRTSESFSGPIKSEFDDEVSLNYELGTKTTWLDGALLANLTGYFTDYREFQAQVFDGANFVVDNAGQLYSWGFEAELRWVPDFVPDRSLVLGGAFGLNFTRYKSFLGAPATVPQQAATVAAGGQDPNLSGLWCGLPSNLGGFDCSQDLTGQRLSNAPRISLSLFAAYEKEIPRTSLIWFANGNYTLETFRYIDTDLDSNVTQDPTNILGLRTGFKTDDDRLELSFWVDNTLDQNWKVAGSDVPIINGYWAVLSPPRTYGGTVRLRY